MGRYEWKKIFGRASGKIALIVCAIGLIIICYAATLHVSYTDTSGDSLSGPAAARALRDAQAEWSGPIDETMLRKAVAVNQTIIASDDYQSDDVQRQNVAYSHTQGYETIRNLIAQTFEGFNNYNYFLIDSVDPDEVGQLYERRVQNLEDWLARPDINFSPAEQAYLTEHYEALDTPLVNSYKEGWDTLIYYAPTLILFLMFVIVFLVSGIFPCEHRWKADAIFFSSCMGRNKAVRAKIVAGLSTVTLLYWLAIAFYTVALLLLLGSDGAQSAFQLLKWKAFYNITIWQTYLLTIVGGYLGILFLSLLAMFVSAASGSQIAGVIVPYVLVLAANFLNSLLSSWEVLPSILGLLPDQLLQLGQVLDDFNLYSVFGHITGSVPILFVLYGIFSLLLVPLMYHIYRKTTVR